MKKFILAGIAASALALSACGSAPEAPAPAPVAAVAPTPTPTPTPTTMVATVTHVRDGDTIDTNRGPVRIIGIDTPEKDECGYKPATDELIDLVDGDVVTLTAVPGKDDEDKYHRLLRYVTTSDGEDVGLHQIEEGYAIARYDSRDGYGAHPQEDEYIEADEDSDPYTCAKPKPKATPKPTPKPEPKKTQEPAGEYIEKPNARPGQFCAAADAGSYTNSKYGRLQCKSSGDRYRWAHA